MRKINLNAEREYENIKAGGENPRAAQSKYYWAVGLPLVEHRKKTCEEIKGKRILEIGCGSGDDAKSYVEYADTYVGVDISDLAIKNANSLNLGNSEFLCVDGHDIPQPSKEFDCVIVSGLLHHLDLSVSFPEISRLLKEDGVLIFREPLGTNLFFQLYRKLTPSARTVDERPFSHADIRLMEKYFSFTEVRWFGFFNILSAFVPIKTVRLFLTKVDSLLARTALRNLFWQFSGIATKTPLP